MPRADEAKPPKALAQNSNGVSHNQSKSKQSKKSQLLISRFFASSSAPVRSAPSDLSRQPLTQTTGRDAEAPRVQANSTEAHTKTTDIPISTGSDTVDGLGSQFSTQPPTKSPSHPPTSSPSSNPQTSQAKTSVAEEVNSEPLTLKQPSTLRRRRRLFDINEDEGSECTPLLRPVKRTRSAKSSATSTPTNAHLSNANANAYDFGVDADDEDTSESRSDEVIAAKDADFVPDAASDEEGSDDFNGEDAQDENSSVDSDKHPELNKPSTPSTSLALFSHEVGASVIPRDEKKHQRFINRLARLETKNFFSKYAGKAASYFESSQTDCKRPDSTSGSKKLSRNVKYTPLESQYVALRAKHPNMLLVVECGYKYRLFDNDAAIASKVLRVASYVDHNFLTASFPTHRLAHHVARLVDAGHKVGVVSQSETAALKKAGENASKLFQRTLSAVYTKGTIAADGKLSLPGSINRSTSYIIAVSEVREQTNVSQGASSSNKDVGIVMAAVDCTTGDVVYDGFLDDILRSDLESRLVTIDPIEVVMPSSSLSKQTESILKVFAENGNARIERSDAKLFNVSKDVTDLNDSVTKCLGDSGGLICQGVLKCIGALVEYLKAFELELSLTRVRGFKAFRSGGHMRLGADVLRNFEVFGNSNNGSVEGSLFGLLNRAHTPFGKRQMRKWVSQPLIDPAEIQARLDTVQYLRDLLGKGGSVSEAEGINKALDDLTSYFVKIPDVERGLMRISCGKCTPLEVYHVITAMDEVGKRTDQIKWRNPPGSFPALLKEIIVKAPVVSEIMENPVVTVLNREAAVKDNYRELFQGGDLTTSEQLGGVEGVDAFVQCTHEVEEAQAELAEEEDSMDALLTKLKKKHASPKWTWKKVGQDEYLLEVEKAKASSMPKAWTIVCETKSVKRFRPDVAEEGYHRVLCAREKLDAVCKRCWKEYVDILAGVVSRLRGLVRMLADIDCLVALARVSLLPGYSKPTVLDAESLEAQTETGGIKAVNARHALTENLPSCATYVPNDVHVGVGTSTRGIVISGPNYGGKSSYARMTALLAMMAQTGSYVPAESLEIRPFDAVYARMGASDCMAKGMSSLMVELAETSRILSEASNRSLVILDELGRGTSTHDGAAIAYATMSHFLQEIRCVTIFVTHYPMLAGLKAVFPQWVDACYMDYKEEADGNDASRKKITLLYKVTQGVAPHSYGLNVARLAGIPSSVIDEALHSASSIQSVMDRQKLDNKWASVLSNCVWNSEDSLRSALQKLVRRL